VEGKARRERRWPPPSYAGLRNVRVLTSVATPKVSSLKNTSFRNFSTYFKISPKNPINLVFKNENIEKHTVVYAIFHLIFFGGRKKAN